MSAQKDEFEQYLLNEIGVYKEDIALLEKERELFYEVKFIINTLEKSLNRYKEIKAKNVCKNCRSYLSDGECIFWNKYPQSNQSCSEFQHAT